MTVSIANLDAAQQAAVKDLIGPVLIQASAGSGKTAVIAARVARLLEQGVPQNRILCITFTNKAADEMRSRIESYSSVPTDGMWIGTFHSICASLLKLHGNAIGLDPGFSICSDKEARSLLREIIRQGNLGPKVIPRRVQAEISRAKHRGAAGDDHATKDSDNDAGITVFTPLLHQAYQTELRQRGALDFDDLIVQAARLLADDNARQSIASQFEYALVDEFQDTTPVEAEIVKALASVHGNVCAVGDVKQSIYGFRMADYRLMKRFADAVPDCRIHNLNTNYRSARRIIAASERLIAQSKVTPCNGTRAHRSDAGIVRIGRYESDDEESAAVAVEIERLTVSGISGYAGIAVLFRQHWVGETLKQALKTASLPFHVVNSEADQTYDIILECLRLIARAETDCGETSASDWVLAHREVISSLRGMVACGLSLSNLIRQIVDHVCGSDWDSHPPQLSSLWEAANQHEGPAEAMLGYVFAQLDSQSTRPTDAVQLMTIHQSKGLEFPVVFLIGLEEGVLPCWQSLDDENALEEERRLCYVAMTRAMDRLYLSSCRQRRVNGRGRPFYESRFLHSPESISRLAVSQSLMSVFQSPDSSQRKEVPVNARPEHHYIPRSPRRLSAVLPDQEPVAGNAHTLQ